MIVTGLILLILGIPIGIFISIFFYNRWIQKKLEASRKLIDRDPETGIIRGAEPFFMEGRGDTACLLVHGFIGSPTDFGRLPQILNEAGCAVSAILLPGHGTDPSRLEEVMPSAWIQAVDQAYSQLKEKYSRVVLIGMSLGASLSLMLAAEKKVDALILAAPYFEVKEQKYYVLPVALWHRLLSRWVPYVYRTKHFKQVYKKDNLDKIVDYSFVPLKSAKALFEIGRSVQAVVRRVRAPLLMIHSRKDKAAAYGAARRGWNEIPIENKSFLRLEKSNHLIFWDYEAETVENTILQFIKTLRSGSIH